LYCFVLFHCIMLCYCLAVLVTTLVLLLLKNLDLDLTCGKRQFCFHLT